MLMLKILVFGFPIILLLGVALIFASVICKAVDYKKTTNRSFFKFYENNYTSEDYNDNDYCNYNRTYNSKKYNRRNSERKHEYDARKYSSTDDYSLVCEDNNVLILEDENGKLHKFNKV